MSAFFEASVRKREINVGVVSVLLSKPIRMPSGSTSWLIKIILFSELVSCVPAGVGPCTI